MYGAREIKTSLERFAEAHKIELEHHLICTVSVTPVLVVLGCLTPGARTARYSTPLLMRATFPPNKWFFNDLTSEAFNVVLRRPTQRSDKLILSVFTHDLTHTQSAIPTILEKSFVATMCLQNYNFYTYEYGGSCSDSRVLLRYGLYARFRKMPRRRLQNCQAKNTNQENKYSPCE